MILREEVEELVIVPRTVAHRTVARAQKNTGEIRDGKQNGQQNNKPQDCVVTRRKKLPSCVASNRWKRVRDVASQLDKCVWSVADLFL